MAQRTVRSIEPQLDAKHDSLKHQSEAVLALRDLPFGAVFHEQGLGKTKVGIDLILYWLEKKVIDTALVVTKKSLIRNWIDEFGMHSHIKPRIISQDQRANFYAFNSPSRVLLTHYETLRTEQRMYGLFLKTRSVAIILDESTKIKNPDSALTKAYFDLGPSFKKRFIMTGTPIANRPYDLWAQIYFLDQGEALGHDFPSFKTRFDLSNSLSTDKGRRADFEAGLENLFNLIGPFSVRKTKKSAGLKLPTKDVHTVRTEWDPAQRELYEKIRRDLKAIVVRSGVPSEDKSDDLLKRMLRLVQVASNPILVDESYVGEPGKVESLRQILDPAVTRGEKAIVWTSFTENAEWLKKKLGAYNATIVHGKLPIDLRNKHIAQFKNDQSCKLLIATPGSAKEGLTLTNANHVVFYDRTFSLDDYLQAQDRIHRISQRRNCHVHNLIMQDSIDEWIELLLQTKHLAAQLAQKDISVEYYRSQVRYDFGDVMRSILGIHTTKVGNRNHG